MAKHIVYLGDVVELKSATSIELASTNITFQGQSQLADGTILVGGKTGSGNPNGSIIGNTFQLYKDVVNSMFYICRSVPSGTEWDVF